MAKGWIEIDVESLTPSPENYKDGGDEPEKEKLLMDALEENIKRNGVIENILVRELDTGFFEVVNGNHRYKVVKKLGIEKIMCFNLGKITLLEAKRVAIETNETRFQANRVKLAEEINALMEDYDVSDLLSTMPYTENELDDFKKMIDFDWSEDDDVDLKPSSGADEDDEFRVVKLNLPSEVADQLEGQIERFKKILKRESIVQPIEAICQILIQTEDDAILGE